MTVSPSETGENRSIYRFRWIGYGLLIFATFDALQVLIPQIVTDFGNPEWRFGAIGKLVETAAVPLLGMGFVFFGEYFERKPIEKLVLRILSWLCLVLSILFLLMIPPAIISTFQLSSQVQQGGQALVNQTNQQADQRLQQLEQIQTQLAAAKDEDIKKIGQQLKAQGVDVNPDDPASVKAAIQSRINQLKASLQQAPQTAQSNVAERRANLIKSSIKWNIGALLACVLFFIIWRTTGWAR